MVTLSVVHILYLVLIVGFLIIMACKKSIVVPCTLGILAIGLCITKSPIAAFQALFNTLVWSGNELFGIITVIALVVAMSKALTAIGADRLMIKPLKGFMVSQNTAFFVLGFVMFVVSLCIWPSPAVALVGALMLPLAKSTGMPVIWAAVAMNICGHGIIRRLFYSRCTYHHCQSCRHLSANAYPCFFAFVGDYVFCYFAGGFYHV